MPQKSQSISKAANANRTQAALACLHDTRQDPDSGMHIGLVMLGKQLLRVAIRPGQRTAQPLLIFNGIGANLEIVGPLLSHLDGIEVVIFDVPGAGQSPAPRRPYRMFGMASLARELICHLGYDKVDVMGVSWGGGLAQQFAIQYPRHVNRLILAATSMGGGTMVPGHPRVLMKMVNPRRYTEPGYMRRIAPDIYGGVMRTDASAIDQFTKHVRAGDPRGYRYQLFAMMGWTSLPWLWRIRHPVLILAGRDDPLVPLINARVQAFLLRDARLHIIDDGHLFLLTRADQMAQRIVSFLVE